MRLVAMGLAVWLGCAGPRSEVPTGADAAVEEPAPDAAAPRVSITLLQANVGNLDLGCLGYASNLCFIDVEERIAAALAASDPDVVALQELASVSQCDELDEADPGRVCHPAHAAEIPAQVRRLLGPEYTIACDDRNGFECVGLHVRAGSIRGCDDGSDCEVTALAVAEGCDDGFTMSAAALDLDGSGLVTLVNGHPPSGPAIDCRADQLRRVFDGDAGPTAEPMILAGDFNLDPFNSDEPSVDLWKQHVGPDRAFRYHSGPAEREPPYPTSFSVLGSRTLDHVVSNVARGRCTTLGEAAGSERLDGGDGMDHRALLCELEL